MNTASYSIGRFIGSHRVLTVIAVVALLGTCTYIDKKSEDVRRAEAERAAAEASKEAAKRRAESEAAESKLRAQLVESCVASGDRMKLAAQEMRVGHAQRAFDALKDCRNHLTDPQVKALYVRSMTAAREQDAAQARRAAASQAAEAKRIATAERAEKKKRGVQIGMTQQDVLDSNWGRPEHVNRTTTARGTHEQWVYGIGSYLYFEDGILTAIQN